MKPHSVFAQQSPTDQWRQIHVRNVRTDIMAYFIDPKHQKEPIEFTIPKLTDPDYSVQNFLNATESGAPDLNFDGVLAYDTQNTLWILSSQKTFDQTKSFVDFMDRPLSQCELELQVVKVSKADLKPFETQPMQAVLKNPYQNSPYKFSALAANSQVKLFATLQATLSKLVQQGKAKIINSPRLTTINHLMTSISTANTIPVRLGVKNENNTYNPLPVDSESNYQIGISKRLLTTFTPDINEAAKTISIDLDLSADEGISQYNTNPKASSHRDKTIWIRDQLNPPLAAHINFRDGQTIEITGLDTSMLGYDEIGYGYKKDNVVIFLTVRILHRNETQ
jgi:type II secretory pathway component GspD/PulD (secretin)